MISEFWAYFHSACAQTAIWELMGPDLQRIVSATYELRMIIENQNKVFDAKLPYWSSLSAI